MVRLDSEWYLEKVSEFFIKDGNNVCNTDGSILSIVGSSPFNMSQFDTYGLSDLSKINSTVEEKIINNKYNIALLK